ncbi:hypothetical protein D1814_08460 [Alteromonas sp. BL110]|uniref:hypothetical protein n=1 Tax=Alteromonas sp. BL110 TaxID=1714845 RepID=UPI000E4ECF11|nr:hypothetical protein [Alteromonas sp. BL110]AXT38700.1 hypothetical protein D1814_08460 [Alteromonas sp. BL110]RKM83150.1 hypothetical protein D7031_03995 [Alteromonas sp. BL110]
MQIVSAVTAIKQLTSRLLLLATCAVLSNTTFAIEAGQYYYFISDKCVAKGPQTPEERGVVTPDVMLFEVVPAGISDYYVNMNTNALVHYAEEGQDILSSLETEQAYTAGKTPSKDSIRKDGNAIHHDFMLQREALDLKTLINTLNGFSQLQSDKGYFFKKIVGLSNPNAKFKAITRVRLSDMGYDNRMMLTSYTSDYFMLDEQGKAPDTPFIAVDHGAALRGSLHETNSPYGIFTRNTVCGEKWEPGN